MITNPPVPATRKNQALAELGRIVATVKRGDKPLFGGLFPLVEKIFDPKTPTYELSPSKINREFCQYGRPGHIASSEVDAYAALLDNLTAFLIERGFRHGITTPQEQALLGSSEWLDYPNSPYTPVGILKGALSVKEAQAARELSMRDDANIHMFVLAIPWAESFVPITLEQLDSEGTTVRDPRPIDMGKLSAAYPGYETSELTFGQILDASVIPHSKSALFKFAR